jgi:Uma2 family endonuclease
VPRLENGQRLTRDEFERRYDAMPDLKKAELIEGVVYVPLPVSHRSHGRPHAHVTCWLAVYAGGTAGVDVGDNSSVRLDLANMPQPDCSLFIQPEHGGRVRIGEEGYIEGPPELAAEVAASSASYDLGVKKDAYLRHGVLEYVVWQVLEGKIDWFVSEEGQFKTLAPGEDGILRSLVFPGLWLDPGALLRGDLSAVIATVQRGLDSSAHAEFLARLKQPRAS